MKKQILEYASGGVGKTNLLGTAAKHVFKTTGKKTRVVTADGGGAGPLEPGIRAGAIDLLDVTAWPYPFRTFDYISRGWWPKDLSSPTPWKELRDPDNQDWSQVRAYGVEGLTAFGLQLMNSMRDRQAKGEQIGAMDGQKLGLFGDGEGTDVLKLGSNTMTHYGIAQSYLYTFVKNFRQLWPRGVDLIVWTALELKATDEAKAPVYGPMLPGKAATATCIPWFTDVLHLDVIDPKKQPDGSVVGERKLFLNNHYANNDPIPFLAKNSAPRDGKMPTVISPDFEVFFSELEKANQRALESWPKVEGVAK